jgi:hypothetical protein
MVLALGLSVVNCADKMLNALRGTSFSVTALTVGLHIGIPGALGTATPSVGDATKKTVTLTASSGGVLVISGTSGPWTNAATSETLSHISVWDGANFLWSAALTSTQAWNNLNTFTLTSLGMSLTPLATT